MLIPKYFQERIRVIAKILLEISGLDIFDGSRKRESVAARTIAAYQLYKEGLTQTAIGALMGKNHSTIVYYIDRMDIILNLPGYKAERETWQEFKDKLDEYDAAIKQTAEELI